ncbi:glucosamine-6-phosphate deaminase [Paenibacillus daejeonensis]|uniref:glucosamine-6-phosphate deaminase n=1 Tax=Paenibacillus daejeonensis TaxID=135193 RepID=UPI000367A6A6|nr:glucosamine-6-phosphate deaminase [Paenibacillus daejeonensis]
MNITIFESNEALDRQAAELIARTITERPDAVLGLATGSTPIGVYRALISLSAEQRLSFADVTTYNLDEYVGLPPAHDQSYAYYMKQHLFDHIDIPLAQTHLPDGMAQDLAAECVRYDQMLENQPIDLQLLGVGHNGHIGFNEPAGQLVGGTHLAELEPATRAANARFFEREELVPQQAITMGVASILKAKHILLVARGADKAEIIQQALCGPITTAIPASLLQLHANVTVLLDKDAGKDLMQHDSSLHLVHS